MQVNRTVASTNMNATSSRAHTIVGVRWGFILISVFLHLIYQTNKGIILWDTFSYFSLFALYIRNSYRGQERRFFSCFNLRSFPPPRFTQKSKNAAGKEMEKKSLINIVDLAGRYKEMEWHHYFFFFLFSDQPIQFGVYFFNNIVDLAWR